MQNLGTLFGDGLHLFGDSLYLFWLTWRALTSFSKGPGPSKLIWRDSLNRNFAGYPRSKTPSESGLKWLHSGQNTVLMQNLSTLFGDVLDSLLDSRVGLGYIVLAGDVGQQDWRPIWRGPRYIEIWDSDDILTVGQVVAKLFAAYEMLHHCLKRQGRMLASRVHLEYGD
jgi:hypothetical protein